MCLQGRRAVGGRPDERRSADAVHFGFLGAVAGAKRRVKALGVSTLQRISALPEVPTIDEAGVSGYNAASCNGCLRLPALPGTGLRILSGRSSGKCAPTNPQPACRGRFSIRSAARGGFCKIRPRRDSQVGEKCVKAAGIKPQ